MARQWRQEKGKEDQERNSEVGEFHGSVVWVS
jgi:hypothetical protein